MNTSEFRTCQIVLYTGTVDTCSCHSAIHAAVTGPGHNSVAIDDISVWHGLAYHTIIPKRHTVMVHSDSNNLHPNNCFEALQKVCLCLKGYNWMSFTVLLAILCCRAVHV